MSEKVVLLANLGSPKSTAVKDVRVYLKEFLMDERVIDIPFLIRSFLVKGIIAPLRARSSAKKYETIWTDEGSPLIVTTEKLTQEVQKVTGVKSYYCMRYAEPSTASVLAQIHEENQDLKEIVLFPLYPHYAMSSYESAVVKVEEEHEKGNYPSKLSVVPPYYDREVYISALAGSMQETLAKTDFDHVLFSYHGIPERHLKKTDCTGTHCLQVEDCCNVPSQAHDVCYRHQVIETTELTAKVLGLQPEQYSFSFQSRLGADAWLKPYTAKELEEMPQRGIKKLVVVCPAFVSDCLETLEEIHEEGEEIFLESGGEKFWSIPCLNTDDSWVQAIDRLIADTP